MAKLVKVDQIPLDLWPLGVCEDAMVLVLSPYEIASRTGLRFDKDVDDLDNYDAALINFGRDRVVALQSYRQAPYGGTNVLGRAGKPNDLIPLMEMLGLDAGEISWVAPWAQGAVDRSMAARGLAA